MSMFDKFISQRELPEFIKWAFGEDFIYQDMDLYVMNKWNERHGDKLMLKGNGQLIVDTEKMIEVWRENK